MPACKWVHHTYEEHYPKQWRTLLNRNVVADALMISSRDSAICCLAHAGRLDMRAVTSMQAVLQQTSTCMFVLIRVSRGTHLRRSGGKCSRRQHCQQHQPWHGCHFGDEGRMPEN